MYVLIVHTITRLAPARVRHFPIQVLLLVPHHKAPHQVHKNRRKIVATFTEIDYNLTQRRHP
jgi:hypothetical protein